MKTRDACLAVVLIACMPVLGCGPAVVNGKRPAEGREDLARPDVATRKDVRGGTPTTRTAMGTTTTATTRAATGALIIVLTRPVPPGVNLELPIARVSGRDQNDVGAYTEAYPVRGGVARIPLAPGFYRVISWRIATDGGQSQIPFEFEEIKKASFITIRAGEDYVVKLRPQP
jgi:hypothetical protein